MSIGDLTPAEERVVRLVAEEGLRYGAAARRMGVTRGAVNWCSTEVLRKTGAKTMAQAVYFLMRAGKIMDETSGVTLMSDDEVVMSMRCDECRGLTEVTRGEQRELLKKFDPRFPTRQEIVTCKCGRGQFSVQARRPK